MSRMSLTLDRTFAARMASLNPCAAYACLADHDDDPAVMSPSEWLVSHRITAPQALHCSRAVEDALAAQLGQRWRGIQSEDRVRAAALTILAAHAEGGDVRNALAAMNSWALADGGRSAARKPLPAEVPDPDASKGLALRKAESKHAWSGTVSLAVLEMAKATGTLPPSAHFLWLRRHDRAMWLLILGHGRPEPFVEVAGIVAHYQAERLMQRKLDAPFMEPVARAVVASSRFG